MCWGKYRPNGSNLKKKTPCLFPECTNPKRHNPNHVDFLSTAIPNREFPSNADDPGYTLWEWLDLL